MQNEPNEPHDVGHQTFSVRAWAKYGIIGGIMKTLLWLPAVFLAGIVIGAWGPREEIRAIKEQERAKSAKRPNAVDGFEAFARIANIPDEAKRPRRRRSNDAPLFKAATNRTPTVIKQVRPVLSDTNTPPTAVKREPPKRISPEDLRARIEEAQDLWRTRAELALTQWKEKLELDEKAAARFDSAIEDMNRQLYDTMQAMAEHLSRQERMTPELGLRMVGDATTIMAETYGKIGEIVPTDKRAEVSEIQVFDFIDPGVAEPLIPVQEKLRNMPYQRPMGMGR